MKSHSIKIELILFLLKGKKQEIISTISLKFCCCFTVHYFVRGLVRIEMIRI